VALVRTDVSEEPGASFIRVIKIGALGTTQAATSNRCTLRRNTRYFFAAYIAVALVRNDVSEEPTLSIKRVAVPVSPILVTLMKEALGSSETSVLTRATWRNIPEDDILHSHRRENLKSYIALTVSPVKYELGFYIPEDAILHSDRHENLKSYTALTRWAL
jgi:hypothetical protein